MTSLVPMRVRAQFVHILMAMLSLVVARSEALAQVVGDFNDDGAADLAIGAADDNVNDDDGAGAAHVLYGVAGSGLASTGSQLWHLDRQNVPEQTEPDDAFGAALAAGDFNGDGIDDLAIGIPGREIGSDEGAGAILVLFGSGAGLTADGAQYLHQDVSGVIDGAESNDAFGAVLTAGNFDGDGFDDLAIGVPGERGDDGDSAGAVNVMYGNNNGLSSGNDQFFQQGSGDVGGDAETDDRFGSALAAGDFDNDGHDDLAVGTPNEAENTGVVHVLYGTAAGLVGTGSQEWSQDNNGIADGAEEDDNFGGALAAGDFDFDGFDDLAIGVPGEDLNDLSDVGAVHVLYGSGNGVRSNGSQLWSQDTDGVLDSLNPGDRFGYSLAGGDFDGDTFADLAIGVAGEPVSGSAEAGAVAVLFGQAGSGLSAAGDEFWHQGVDGILDNPEVEDRFGTVLCTGDFNADDRADLAVGIPFENVGGADAGAVAVIYGSNGGLRAGPDQFWHQNRPEIAETCEPGDHFGGANSA